MELLYYQYIMKRENLSWVTININKTSIFIIVIDWLEWVSVLKKI